MIAGRRESGHIYSRLPGQAGGTTVRDMSECTAFSNAPLSLDDIPTAAELEFQPVSRRYIWVALIYALIVVLPLTLTAGAVHIWGSDRAAAVLQPAYIAAGTVLLLLPGFVWPFLAVPRMGYAIRERDAFHRSGVLWRRVTAVPLVRVQHVETGNGPLERLFGLSTLKIFTAGAMTADVTIHGLPREDADRLHRFLLTWTDDTKDTDESNG